jgi:hypothetical protein
MLYKVGSRPSNPVPSMDVFDLPTGLQKAADERKNIINGTILIPWFLTYIYK